MNFKEFLNEARKQPEAYNFEKIKKELIDAVMPLHKYMRDNYKDDYSNLDKEGVEVSDYEDAYHIDFFATLKNYGKKNDSELMELLKHCMKEAKNVFKKYGLVQDKKHARPSSAARATKRYTRKGTVLDVDFYIGWVKP